MISRVSAVIYAARRRVHASSAKLSSSSCASSSTASTSIANALGCLPTTMASFSAPPGRRSTTGSRARPVHARAASTHGRQPGESTSGQTTGERQDRRAQVGVEADTSRELVYKRRPATPWRSPRTARASGRSRRVSSFVDEATMARVHPHVMLRRIDGRPHRTSPSRCSAARDGARRVRADGVASGDEPSRLPARLFVAMERCAQMVDIGVDVIAEEPPTVR